MRPLTHHGHIRRDSTQRRAPLPHISRLPSGWRLAAAVSALAVVTAACSSGGTTTPTSAAAPSSSAAAPSSAAPSSAAPSSAAPSSAAPTSAASAGGLSGAWSGQYSGAFTGTFKLTWTQSGSKLSGTIVLSTSPGPVPLNGTVNGNTIAFGTVGSVAVTYSGTVSGNSMSGTYKVANTAGGSWSATKS